jgi:hypothetical protein
MRLRCGENVVVDLLLLGVIFDAGNINVMFRQMDDCRTIDDLRGSARPGRSVGILRWCSICSKRCDEMFENVFVPAMPLQVLHQLVLEVVHACTKRKLSALPPLSVILRRTAWGSHLSN